MAAAQEERFTRKKHDARFPRLAISFCLEYQGITLKEVDHVVFYDKPILKFDRLLETYLAFAPRGFRSFLKAMPIWLKEKLYLKSLLRKELSDLSDLPKDELPSLLFSEHHQAHAASAFFPSPFVEAAVLCIDGVGEWATTSVWHGRNNSLTSLWEIRFPHSLGLLYSSFTYYTGFRVNSGEYKMMGLAPFGEPRFVDVIFDKIVHVKEDGSFRLDMSYFDFATSLGMTSKQFNNLFGRDPREPESEIEQLDLDMAASIQIVIEEIVLKLAKTIRRETGSKNLCLAGGVALNCVANGRILRESSFENVWVQPAAGDAGGSAGAALSAHYEYLGSERKTSVFDDMKGAQLGPQFSQKEIESSLRDWSVPFESLVDKDLYSRSASILSEGNIMGWFQGRMEFGPRALGNRSILADPRGEKTQARINRKIKKREAFRPFAPSILEDRLSDYFDQQSESPYMQFVAPLNKKWQLADDQKDLVGLEKSQAKNSLFPAITHVDNSARIQSVSADRSPRFHALLEAFEEITECPILVNTSFNVRGEPIVCTPEDAFRCFANTDMDGLVIGNALVLRDKMPKDFSWTSWHRNYEAD